MRKWYKRWCFEKSYHSQQLFCLLQKSASEHEDEVSAIATLQDEGRSVLVWTCG